MARDRPDLKAYATAVGVPIDEQSGGGTLPGHQGRDHHGVRRQGGAVRLLARRPGGAARAPGRVHRGAPDRRQAGGGAAHGQAGEHRDLRRRLRRARRAGGPGQRGDPQHPGPGGHRRQLRPRPARDDGDPGRGEGRALRPAHLRHRRHRAHGAARQRDRQVPRRRGRVRHHRALPRAVPGQGRGPGERDGLLRGPDHPPVGLRRDRASPRAWRPCTASTPSAW